MPIVRSFLTFALVGTGATSSVAQAPSIGDPALTLAVAPAGPEAPEAAPFVVPTLPRDLTVSDAARRAFRPVVPVREGLAVRLPLPLPVEVSERRDTILQFGDPLYRMHPVRVDLFWIGEEGDVRTSVEGVFAGDAQVEMSRDGFTAVAGSLYLDETPVDRPRATAIRLYAPSGEALAEAELAPDREVTQLRPLPRGRGVLIATVPADDPLGDGALLALDGDRLREVTPRGLGLLQKAVPLGDGALALIQGSAAFGLMDVGEGELRWSRSERIRLVGPHAAALTPDGDRLLTVTGERAGDAALYRWTVSVLDADTGEGLAELELDDAFPGSADPVFAEISSESAVIRTGAELQRVSIEPR